MNNTDAVEVPAEDVARIVELKRRLSKAYYEDHNYEDVFAILREAWHSGNLLIVHMGLAGDLVEFKIGT